MGHTEVESIDRCIRSGWPHLITMHRSTVLYVQSYQGLDFLLAIASILDIRDRDLRDFSLVKAQRPYCWCHISTGSFFGIDIIEYPFTRVL